MKKQNKKDEEKIIPINQEDSNLVFLKAASNKINYPMPKIFKNIAIGTVNNESSVIDIVKGKILEDKTSLEIIIDVDFYSELEFNQGEKEKISKVIREIINQKDSSNILVKKSQSLACSFIKEGSKIVKACSRININGSRITVEIVYFNGDKMFGDETPVLIANVKETIKNIFSHFYQ